MKTTYKALLSALVAVPVLSGCIEEVLPTSGIVQSQLEGSPKAAEAVAMAMPANMVQLGPFADDAAYDWGYPAQMHIRDVMTEDMAVVSSGYNWFQTWSNISIAVGDGYLATQSIWVFYTQQVLACNMAVSTADLETENPGLRAANGAAYAFRASTYMDWARQYEFLPNKYTEPLSPYGENVLGLTVPIVTEKTTEAESKNNPRVSHDEIVAFIKSDLDIAIAQMETNCSPRANKTLPNLQVAYGLMARLCLWDASYQDELGDKAKAATQYANALTYAEKAQSGFTPTTQDEWLSTTSGFNSIDTPSWMWGMNYVQEDDAVQTALLNWTSWMSNETSFGYASAGPFIQIGASLYNRMSDRDFRKLTFIAPAGSSLSGREPVINADFAEENFEEYYSLKFRPGAGNMDDYKTACVVGIPLMRVEEMAFIAMEAALHVNGAADAQSRLENFMKTYRYPTYRCFAEDEEELMDEIIFQKRVELFGEGLSYFDVKRLNMSVTRWYDGTNFNIGADTYNTEGRPAWMNFVIIISEGQNNVAIEKFNNPSPYEATPVLQ